ncbi:hypothetical protein D5S17_24020 [Pseudonocardiaceae bacterium YIM PH 21723]|nr:hypothetical protein D5S17_24020 [Pseudonocardiaceae bacterium YIM PH 21723]
MPQEAQLAAHSLPIAWPLGAQQQGEPGVARGRIVDVRRTTAHSATLTVQPASGWGGFLAGQSLRFAVPVDGTWHLLRTFPASSQHTAQLEFTVTRRGPVSEYLITQGRRGLPLLVGPAAGTFVLPLPRPQRLLLVSAGRGITPALSLLRTLCDEGHEGDVTFLHYCHAARDLLHREDLEQLERHPGVRVERRYTTAHGRFDPQHLDGLAEQPVYVSGPETLVDAVTAVTARWAEPTLSEISAPTMPDNETIARS